MRKQGRTVLISSHILSDLSEMCTDICIIDEGRCLMDGSVDEIEYHMITASCSYCRQTGRCDPSDQKERNGGDAFL